MRDPHPNHMRNGTWIDITLTGEALKMMALATAHEDQARFAIEVDPDLEAVLKVRFAGSWGPGWRGVEVVQQGAYGDGT